jgi:hypothetical protein
MTTVTSVAATLSRNYESPRRILAVLRLLFVNKVQILYTPLAALGGIFLLNLAIWWIIIAASPNNRGSIHLGYSGAVSYIYVYAIIIAVQTLLRTFPFSLGFGVTRRDFYLGAAATFVVLSTIFAAVLTIMSSIEIATNGWGVGGQMFAPVYFTNSFWLARFVMYLLVFLFCLFVGSVIATIYVRWRALGIVVFFASLAVLIVAAVAEVTLDHQWNAVGSWFATTGTFGIVLWTLVPTAISAVGGFLFLRRATPKS